MSPWESTTEMASDGMSRIADVEGSDAERGGIMNATGSLTIKDSVIAFNVAIGGAGGNGRTGAAGVGNSSEPQP